MSGAGFHVHGPHDHELEHAAQHADRDSFAGTIAVVTALLATVGALFAYMGGATQANASLYKNNAAIKKTEAANQWNYYQAKSSKQNLAELAAELVATDDKRAQYRSEVERYKKEKGEIQKAAEALEVQSRDWDAQSDAQMHVHHRWAQATTALQIAIAMAAIALLTKRKWLEWAMFGMAGIGLVLGGLAGLHI
jgi:lipopolysaccharide export LptBFGC system permease protein LptF